MVLGLMFYVVELIVANPRDKQSNSQTRIKNSVRCDSLKVTLITDKFEKHQPLYSKVDIRCILLISNKLLLITCERRW